MKALELAIKFHETYERLAPSFGYETRVDTKVFDPESKNGRLMVAVCHELIEELEGPLAEAEAKVESLLSIIGHNPDYVRVEPPPPPAVRGSSVWCRERLQEIKDNIDIHRDASGRETTVIFDLIEIADQLNRQ